VLRSKGQPVDLLDNAVRQNFRRVITGLRQNGAVLPQAAATRRIKIVGACYDLDNGEVDFFVES
jgi:carbonic anhydrase